MDIIILHNPVDEHAPEDILDIERQARWIESVLCGLGHQVSLLQFDAAGIAAAAPRWREEGAILFNLVDASAGQEDLAYFVPGLLGHLGLPYTGCTMESLFLTTDKLVAKQLMHARGIDTPPWISHEKDITRGGRYLVKPVRDDASIGIDEHSLVDATDAGAVLREIARRTAATGKGHYAEQFIDGREFTVCLYGPAAQPVAMSPYEWVFEGFEERGLPRMFTFAAKWDDTCYAFDHITDRHAFTDEDQPLLDRLRGIALECWHLFGLSGYARIDFRIDAGGRPWVLEANGNPSFYGFYHSAPASGTTFAGVLEAILSCAHPQR